MHYRLQLHSGTHDREQCPVRVSIPVEPERLRNPKLRLEGVDYLVPCQLSREGDGSVVRWIVENLPRGERLSYVLETGDEDEERTGAGVRLSAESDRVHVSIDGRYATTYYYGSETPKPYLGPMLGPYGDSYTRLDFQTREHPHHRSIWLGHGEVNGLDIWGEPRPDREGSWGRQVHKAFDELTDGPVHADIRCETSWEDLEGKKVLDEKRLMRVYRTPDHMRILDVNAEVTARYGRVTLGGTKEAGLFAVRVAEGMSVKNGGRFVNAHGGVNEAECWSKRAPWCDYSGSENGHLYGVAIFDHPDNARFPTTWHIRNYGLMSPNMYLLGERILEPTETLTVRYRVLFHTGDAEYARVAQRFQDFVNPPEITVE